MTKEDSIKEMKNMMTKGIIAEMYYNLDEIHKDLVKWLYDNYLPILREWEGTKGNLRIEFLNNLNQSGGSNGS